MSFNKINETCYNRKLSEINENCLGCIQVCRMVPYKMYTINNGGK